MTWNSSNYAFLYLIFEPTSATRLRIDAHYLDRALNAPPNSCRNPVRGATSHSGRRAYITKLANAGINVRLLAELAGHKHISTTQRYIDVNDTQLAHAVKQATDTRFPPQLGGERWSEWSNYTETITAYITVCFTMYIMV